MFLSIECSEAVLVVFKNCCSKRYLLLQKGKQRLGFNVNTSQIMARYKNMMTMA